MPDDYTTALGAALQQSPNYINPDYSTPAQRAQLYALAQGLMGQNQPINNWAQGLGSLSGKILGALQMQRANQLEGQNAALQMQKVGNTIGTIESPTSAAPAQAPVAGAPPAQGANSAGVSSVAPAAASYLMRNGVTNPLGQQHSPGIFKRNPGSILAQCVPTMAPTVQRLST